MPEDCNNSLTSKEMQFLLLCFIWLYTTTTLYKLIFNAVQHHACQRVAQDIKSYTITHFSVWQRVIWCISLFFLCSCRELKLKSSAWRSSPLQQTLLGEVGKAKQRVFKCVQIRSLALSDSAVCVERLGQHLAFKHKHVSFFSYPNLLGKNKSSKNGE